MTYRHPAVAAASAQVQIDAQPSDKHRVAQSSYGPFEVTSDADNAKDHEELMKGLDFGDITDPYEDDIEAGYPWED